MVKKAEHVRISIYVPPVLRDGITDLQAAMQRETGVRNIPLSSVAAAVIQRGLDAMQNSRVTRTATQHL